ncbi:MAG: FAD-binding and (Fe-S)-binding domain-containing protein [Candidatus Odinarchaeia archaeon]
MKAEFVEDLKLQIEGDIFTSDVVRALYSTDASIYEVKPLAVINPKNKRDVVNVVKYAAKKGIPIHPRGAGTGLAGQSLGPGIVLNFTKYMTRILELNINEGWVKVEPGVIYGVLNDYLTQYGKIFPPDPASGDYCTIGGMIGNNASGAHAIKYGSTIDNIYSAEVVLPNGEIIETKPYNIHSNAFKRLISSNTLEGKITREIYEIIKNNQELIKNKVPKTEKNCSGYRLDKVLEGDIFNLTKLFVASEGTLGVIVSAKLKIIDIPKFKGVVLLYFDELNKAGKAVGELRKLNPVSIEIMDKKYIELVRESYPEFRDRLPPKLDTILLVEFDGQEQGEIRKGIQLTEERIVKQLHLAFHIESSYDPVEQAKLWAIRKAAIPILNKLKGPKRITAFIEDVAVDAFKLPEYIVSLHKIFDKYDLKAVIYGHAGQGNMHTRPLLNLKDQKDIEKMVAVADEVFKLVVKLGGTMSGEHGDGFIRSKYVPLFYGELYNVFKKIKKFLDPNNIMNPGRKIAEDPEIMTKNLRYGAQYQINPKLTETLLVFRDNEFVEEIEKCHGCGKCTTPKFVTTTCPPYKISLDERDSPRAKANLLRWIIKGGLDADLQYREEYRYVIYSCINCGACEVECPSEVNIPKLVLEGKARYALNKHSNVVFSAIEQFFDVYESEKKKISSLDKNPVKVYLSGVNKYDEQLNSTQTSLYTIINKKNISSRDTQTIVYFPGFYATFLNPNLGRSIIETLEKLGYNVIVPKLKRSGIFEINSGNIDKAKQLIKYNVNQLTQYVTQGFKIVCSSPSILYTVRKQYPMILDNPDVIRVSQNTYDICEFLWLGYSRGELKFNFKEVNVKLVYHQPCRLTSLKIGSPGLELLKLIPGVTVNGLKSKCCGISCFLGLSDINRALRIGESLFKSIEETESEKVVTDCEFCIMQIEKWLKREVNHPIEILQCAL